MEINIHKLRNRLLLTLPTQEIGKAPAMGPFNHQTDTVKCYSAFSDLLASYAALFSTYFYSVRLCHPTQLSAGDLPQVHELIAIAS